MITFMDTKEKLKDVERSLDSQLWHACAGGMVQMPPVNSKVFYFPQGHAEHSNGPIDFRTFPRIPPYIPCRVSGIKFMADPETDEVYAKIRLLPVPGKDFNSLEEDSPPEGQEKPASFAKTLTQSDANNGGGFSVPRYCAETIFPRLDYSADPPVQTILAKDVHGETWKFRHIYRGTPRRHLLTTGWSTFVNQKKLVAGDSIVFMRAENGDLCVGIRRAKRGIGCAEASSGWNPVGGNCPIPFGGFSAFLREEDNRMMRNGNANNGKGKVTPDDVVEAVKLASSGQVFEVVYYPRASTPEFCVKAVLVKSAMQIRWCSGMRFKMPFETEDSSRISWFMGTISSVQVADPVHWPDSPWRLLQVSWDEPDLLQNVKRVSPWLVELVSNMPTIHLSPFSPSRKKPRLPQYPEFPIEGQFPVPPFSNNILGRFDNHPAGMQGARHAHYGLSPLPVPDLHLPRPPNVGPFLSGYPQFDHHQHHHHHPLNRSSNGPMIPRSTGNDSIASFLTLNSPSSGQPKKNEKPELVLFGQKISPEQQSSAKSPGNKTSSDGKPDNDNDQIEAETGPCKVFMESEDVGRTLDLSLLSSYEELCRKLSDMFGLESLETLNHVQYRDGNGVLKHIGDEPFSEFMNKARRLMIPTDSSSDNVGI